MLFSVVSLVLATVHLLWFSSRVAGQSSDVVCGSNYTWAENSLQQNPCVVASYLQGVCDAGAFTVQALPPNEHYLPPVANECECNTVVYSLISACADCQGGFYLGWTEWAVNCSVTYIDAFPEAIPSGTAVPAWAYLDVLGNNLYSPQAAQQDVSAPESKAPTATSPTSTSVIHSTTVGSITPITSATSGTESPASPTASSSNKKSNVAAIAGGVVGGLVFLGLVAGLVIFLVVGSRRGSRVAPSAAFLDAKPPLAAPPPMGQFGPTSDFAVKQGEYAGSGFVAPSTISPPPGSQYSSDPLLQQPRPYDPSDPSTFPNATNFVTPGYLSQAQPQGYSSSASSQGYQSQLGPQGYPSPSPPGSQGYPSQSSSPGYGPQTQYRGAPQV